MRQPFRNAVMIAPNSRWTPHVTVATVVFRDNRYLLVEESIDGRHVLNQPAGHLEEGETLVEAARRETLEETGWEVRIEALLGSSLFPGATDHLAYLRTSFLATPLRQLAPRSLEAGIVATHWMSFDEVLAARERLRSESVLATIAQHRSGRRFPLDFFYPQS